MTFESEVSNRKQDCKLQLTSLDALLEKKGRKLKLVKKIVMLHQHEKDELEMIKVRWLKDGSKFVFWSLLLFFFANANHFAVAIVLTVLDQNTFLDEPKEKED